MTDTDQEFPWLPPATVLAWLKVDAENDDKVLLVEVCRKGAADWIEDQRPDLVTTGVVEGEDDEEDTTGLVFGATARIVQAGLLAAARLFARVDSPNGVVAFDELGAGSILAKDPDVMRMLGRAKWKVG